MTAPVQTQTGHFAGSQAATSAQPPTAALAVPPGGGIILSSVVSRYQLGFAFHAGSLTAFFAGYVLGNPVSGIGEQLARSCRRVAWPHRLIERVLRSSPRARHNFKHLRTNNVPVFAERSEYCSGWPFPVVLFPLCFSRAAPENHDNHRQSARFHSSRVTSECRPRGGSPSHPSAIAIEPALRNRKN
jgi:hypothetical protein